MGVTLGMSGGQPVAAGDLQISDVAVMPLMKLTQHSLSLCLPVPWGSLSCPTPRLPQPCQTCAPFTGNSNAPRNVYDYYSDVEAAERAAQSRAEQRADPSPDGPGARP
uniref:Uncharacterized protein n=1 Tax=Knipowitschia caucasica TaxID=637954 RepID=A0AAV2MFS3_KNICA